ncbi:MAG: hypothetical protein EBZ74_12470, partial [Planctomycetia bacterium]|nr:hypothetical protein [Planctomycetia bacterium]
MPLLVAIVWPVASGGQEPAVAEQAEVARDRAPYAGTWKIVAIESDGETKPSGAAVLVPIRDLLA